jgi:hypothetical protein
MLHFFCVVGHATAGDGCYEPATNRDPDAGQISSTDKSQQLSTVAGTGKSPGLPMLVYCSDCMAVTVAQLIFDLTVLLARVDARSLNNDLNVCCMCSWAGLLPILPRIP